MNEIYIIQAEYLDKIHGTMLTSQCGATFDYEKAKEQCQKIVDEDEAEGQFPKGYDGWNEPEYHDMFCYDDEMSKVLIYVCAVEMI